MLIIVFIYGVYHMRSGDGGVVSNRQWVIGISILGARKAEIATINAQHGLSYRVRL
jgi:hypothetical protein